MDTKGCNLTKDEIQELITSHGRNLNNPDKTEVIDRINYLHKRLKAFDEPEAKVVAKQDAAANAVVQGWGNGNG